MIKTIFPYLGTWLLMEIIAIFLFFLLRKYFLTGSTFSMRSAVKGLLERLVLFIGLSMGYTSILVLFGALKIGTRISGSKDDNISNDYFLVGNLASVLLVLIASAFVGTMLNY